MNEKEIKLFFENKILENFEKYKEKKITEMKFIEEERSAFKKMSYMEKVKHKGEFFVSNSMLAYEMSIFCNIPFAIAGFIGCMIFLYHNISIFTCLLAVVFSFSFSFIFFYGFYFLCNFIDRFLDLKPDFEGQVFDEIESLSNTEDCYKSTIKELNDKDFYDGKLLSLQARNVLRNIIINKEDISKIETMSLEYKINENNDLLDLYFSITKNL